MSKYLAQVVLILLTVGTVLAQDNTFPRIETSPAFMFIRTPTSFTAPNGTKFNESFNCAGGGGTFAYNFTSLLGIAADLGGCKYFGETVPALSSKLSGTDFTYMFGPRFTFRSASAFRPFFEVNFGGNRLSLSCNSGTPCSGITYTKDAFALTAGGGFDIKLSKKFALRLIQAEYLYTRFGNSCQFALCSDNNNQNSFRLKSGIVIGWGFPETEQPSASCSVQPSEVMVGEPITATATGSNFNPKHTLSYTWSATGGNVTGKGNTASIDTTGLAGGSYTVTAHITDAKMKKGGDASCSASYTVKEPPKNPPTMSCSGSPSSLQGGGSSTITCNCSSPDNIPVTVASWTATGGSVSGSGNTGTLNTSGASTGPITVTATCTDSRGLSSQASTQVTVENPPPPPPQASKLTDCDFSNMAKIKKPWRVDNECKGKLDDVAKNLQQNADNKLVIVGNADPSETRPYLAAERAVNSKAYLTSGEAQLGIDPSRIETRTDSAGTKTAEYWIEPAGATFSETGTQPVDESQVQAVPDHPTKKRAKAKQ
ncbi:MAG TPA: outer membrane beta-barrel protein [Terriglobales bacterium]|nr:outer membrane beta-barrel protein [Terriglobales bacterium]